MYTRSYPRRMSLVVCLRRDRPRMRTASWSFLLCSNATGWGCQRKDRNALEDSLAPEFVVRASVDPEHSVGRADWIQDVLANHKIRSYDLHAMTIRSFGVAIVSLLQAEQATIGGKKTNTNSLIVDIWEANHGKNGSSSKVRRPSGETTAS
jgi:hypothetical protein